VACDLPGVGANLQDHLALAVAFARKQSGPLARSLRYDAIAFAMLRAYCFGAGVAANVPGGVMALLRTRPELDVPDVQLSFRGLPREAKPWWPGSSPSWQDSFAYPVALLHPRSRGRVEIASSDPARAVQILPEYLSVDADIEPLLAGIRIAREVTRQAPLARFAGEEIFPGCGAGSEQDLKGSIRKGAGSFHHACGTCRMGSDETAVVDTQLRVRGLERLRVVDASVLPDIVGGNINACVIMIAEKASDLIRGRELEALTDEPPRI
jgi:choline dehydrogenase-like flavoprotein